MPVLDQAALTAPVGATEIGFTEVLAGTSPAAGASFALTMEGRYLTRIASMCVRLVADANAANRNVQVTAEAQGGLVYHRSPAALTQTANQTVDYAFNLMHSGAAGLAGVSAFAPLAPVFMRPTDVLRITVANVQATDQLSAIAFYFERFYTELAR